MRRGTGMLIMPLLALLAGCEFRTKNKGEGDRGPSVAMSVKDDGSAAEGLSIDTPAFQGKLNIPGLDLGGDQMDLDGIKLYPGSKVSGVNVDASKPGKDSRVQIAFTSDAAPEAVLEYYRTAAERAGYRVTAPSGMALNATKGDSSFALSVRGAGPGSGGTIVMSGS